MSEMANEDEEILDLPNEYVGVVRADTQCIARALYALAREVRALRKESVEVSKAIDRLTHELPVYDGALQVSR